MADVTIDIELITAAFDKALKESSNKVKNFSGQIDKSQKGVDKSFNKIQRSAKDTAGSFTVLKGATAAFLGGLALNAITSFTNSLASLGSEMINLAVDAEETRSKFAVVFGDISDIAEKTANNLSTSFGLGAVEARGLLSATGDLLTGFGFTQEASLGLSDQVQKLAVDLASFSNFSGGAKGASEALTKALLGERESVKALGISIQEKDVVAQVAINTAKGLIFESERQAKAQATLDIALKQSKNALGDYANTSGSAANQSKLFDTRITDLKENIGGAFTPFVKQAYTEINQFIASLDTEAIKEFITSGLTSLIENLKTVASVTVSTFKVFKKAIEDNRLILESMAIAFGIVGTAAAAYATATFLAANATAILSLAVAATPWGLALLGVTALVAGVKLLVENFDLVVGVLKVFAASVIEFVVRPVQIALSVLADVVRVFDQDMGAAIDKSIESISNFTNAIKEEGNEQIASVNAVKTAVVASNSEIIANEKKTLDEKQVLRENADAKETARLQAVASKAAELEAQRLAAIKAVQDEAEVEKQVIEVEKQISLLEGDEENIERIRQLEIQKIGIIRDAEIEKAALLNGVVEQAKASESARQKANIATIKVNNKAEIDAEKVKQGTLTSIADVFNAKRNQNLKSSLGTIATLQSSSNKTLFGIGKAGAIATATIDGYSAVQKALSAAPPPFNFILAGLVGAASAVNIGNIASASPPSAGSFQNGGIVGGNSFSGDNLTANVNSGELILNRNQQQTLFNVANGSSNGEGGGSLTADNIREIVASTVAGMQVTLVADDNEIARSTSRGVSNGVVIGVSA